MAYAVVRTDKMFGTDVRSGLVSAKYMGAGSSATAIENGNVIKLDSLVSGEREIYKAVTPAANDALKDIVLVASPEVMYDERKHNLDEFINEAGKIVRGYYLHENDIFSVTKDALVGTSDPAVGDIVELAAGTKLNVASEATSSSTQVGKIIEVADAGKYTYYAIQVD
ncbi:MAG: hypothetical protein KBS82_05570 [Oscillospiraceae bacterium]|nr:hypothetical protein [Candidatus Limimonas egerieequi]